MKHVYRTFAALSFVATTLATSAPLGDASVHSMASNIGPNQALMRDYAPKLWIRDGCRPIKAFDEAGQIDWVVSDASWEQGCHSRAAPQMYVRQMSGTINGEGRTILVYAWLTQLDWPATKHRTIDWQYMAVIPPMLGKPTLIWTPVQGLLSQFPSDADGHHPHIQQRRWHKSTAPGIASVHPHSPADPANLELFPLIDVDGGGAWSAHKETKAALDTPPSGALLVSPLSYTTTWTLALFGFTTQRITAGAAIGYPEQSVAA